MGHIQGWHIIILVVLALLLFGAPKLPGLARSVGQSLRIFKSEVRQMKDDDPSGTAAGDPVEGRIVNNPATPGTPSAKTPPTVPGTPGAAGTPGTDPRTAGNPPTGL